MRIIGLILALVVVSSVSFAATQQATIAVYDQFNWVGAPIVPLDPNPVKVFGTAKIDPGWAAVLGKLDPTTNNQIAYDPLDPNAQFNVLLGEGYFLDMRSVSLSTTPYTVTYTGIPDGVPDGTGKMTDMWISLPGLPAGGGGTHWISTPFNHAIKFNKTPEDGANILITDGSTVRTVKEASEVEPVWIDLPFQYYDGSSRNMLACGYFTGVDDDDMLRPGVGYIVRTRVSNLALIIPAY